MKNFVPTILGGLLLTTTIPAMAQDQGSGDAYLLNPDYNVSGSDAIAGYSGSLGCNFQVLAADVPSGDTVYITALGYYAGTSSTEFVGGGTVTSDQTLALYGGSATPVGNLGSDELASVTLDAGATVDANGFAWVTLTTPVALTAGDYYDLLTTEAGSEVYLDPYDDGSSGNAVMSLTAGSPFLIYEGAYSTSGYAYSDSTYLGPDMQYEIEGPTPVPEPAAASLAAAGLTMLLIFRRRNQPFSSKRKA